MTTGLARIPFKGVIYHTEDGAETGSITIHPEYIAFIAGRWCRMVRLDANRQKLLEISGEHIRRMQLLT